MSATPELCDDFTFAMGEHVAPFRGDRRYATNHMWALQIDTDHWRFGLTAYAVRLLQDVYFLDWVVDPPSPVNHRQCIGSIESKKAESDLYSPAAGSLIAINTDALDDPSAINASPYDDGWLFDLQCDGTALLSPGDYRSHLDQAWVVAQRTIKGQTNQA